jgi:hypothetical protein
VSVWEPYTGDPVAKYGEDIHGISKRSLAVGREIMRKYHIRERRKKRKAASHG